MFPFAALLKPLLSLKPLPYHAYTSVIPWVPGSGRRFFAWEGKKDVSCFLSGPHCWGWVHLSLPGLMTMAALQSPSPPPLGCQSNSPYMSSLAHTFSTPLGMESRPLGLHVEPAGSAFRLLANHICTCSPSHPARHSQSYRSLHGLAFQLRVPPLALPGRLEFAPRPQVLILPAASPAELGPPSSMLWKHFWQGECGKVVKIQTGRQALPHTMQPLVNK